MMNDMPDEVQSMTVTVIYNRYEELTSKFLFYKLTLIRFLLSHTIPVNTHHFSHCWSAVGLIIS